MPMTTAYTWVASPAHEYENHPERPGRLTELETRLSQFKIEKLDATPATRDEIALVHAPRMIEAVDLACASGGGIIDYAPTFVNPSSFDDALLASGGTLGCARAVWAGEASDAFAIVRPPGHHAGKDYAGGYCFINNASVAANWLSERGKVALLDIDYHCGNGTQDIFYEREDVFTISIHADPDFEYPHSAGFANETGSGKGLGFHRNFPLPAGTDDVAYLKTLEEALGLIQRFNPRYLVISAGMDIYADDPLGTIRVTTDGIGEIGKRIAALGLPSVIVMEGGYNNDVLGTNVVTFLDAFK